jgi:putative transposase
MTNHVHLLATPHNSNGISSMMQGLGRQYVSWFNQHYQRTGTLWEGRFRSCQIESEHYLLRCYRYIEMNPVRAGMVSSPAEYEWSSFRCNALGWHSRIVVPHELYSQLGKSPKERHAAYLELFNMKPDSDEIDEFRDAINKGLALGSEGFKTEFELRWGRRLRSAPRGRPYPGRQS